ncbi:hypothetical protein SynBMKMC1_01061 [Synechococcus sp. BMK-MC-1]|nr:hypothetical protein SynBMKMC1_01061 [Synechococcus sp. BMK-MC-1]
MSQILEANHSAQGTLPISALKGKGSTAKGVGGNSPKALP